MPRKLISNPMLGAVLIALAAVILVSSWSLLGQGKLPTAVIDEKVSYKVWAKACADSLAGRLYSTFPSKEQLPLKDPQPLYRLADKVAAEGRSLKPWIGRNPPAPRGSTFRPFAQKLSLPPKSRVVVQGDLHGDLRSLMAGLAELQRRKILTGFKVTAPNTHLLFLGDYTDRGFGGVEVLYTLLRLRLENPRRVWLVRGNHEDPYMTARYGFREEGVKKYGDNFDHQRVVKFFESLPAVIYVGTNGNFFQSCHGGMEPGYDPRDLLRTRGFLAYQRLGTLKRERFYRANRTLVDEAINPAQSSKLREEFVDFTPKDPGTPRSLGFMWYDFTLYQNEPGLTQEERLQFGYSLTQGILKAHSSPNARVRGVLRAHQQSSVLDPMMRRLIATRGIFRHWQEREIAPEEKPPPQLEDKPLRSVTDGGVYTFNVSPDSRYGKGCQYRFHTFGILSLSSGFKDWVIEAVNVTVPET